MDSVFFCSWLQQYILPCVQSNFPSNKLAFESQLKVEKSPLSSIAFLYVSQIIATCTCTPEPVFRFIHVTKAVNFVFEL